MSFTSSAVVALTLASSITLMAPVASADDGGVIAGTVTAKPGKFLPDTIVFLKKAPARGATHTFKIDQVGMVFVPHVVVATVGDSVTFTNHDPVLHNVTSPDGKYDLGTWGQNESKDHEFKKAGVYSQICKVHPEMLAYVFVGQNPYAAVVDGKGGFTITGVPAGTYELDVWNPHLKAAGQPVVVAAGATVNTTFALTR